LFDAVAESTVDLSALLTNLEWYEGRFTSPVQRPAEPDRGLRFTRRASCIRWSSSSNGSLKAQLGRPDMRRPIAVALCYPDRLPDRGSTHPAEELSAWSSTPLDESRFPSVRLAREAARADRSRGRAERGQ